MSRAHTRAPLWLLIACALAAHPALAGTPEASANTMPAEFIAAFALVLLAFGLTVVVLVLALYAAVKSWRQQVKAKP